MTFEPKIFEVYDRSAASYPRLPRAVRDLVKVAVILYLPALPAVLVSPSALFISPVMGFLLLSWAYPGEDYLSLGVLHFLIALFNFATVFIGYLLITSGKLRFLVGYSLINGILFWSLVLFGLILQLPWP